MHKSTRLDLADLNVESFFPGGGTDSRAVLASNYDSVDFCSGYTCESRIACSTGCREPTDVFSPC